MTEAAAVTDGPEAGGAVTIPKSGFGYRPHLDGLRAVAVFLVVLFHGGVGWFEGGFIGVDVFFVLSGYLVTHVLVRDIRDGGGGFWRFYARRIRRLLPAAAATLLLTALVWSWLASPAEIDQAAGGFRAAFLYVSNWWLISETSDYFAADVSANPVLQFWSLSIEEQFYLAWPPLVAGLLWLGRRMPGSARSTMRAATVVLAIASAGWAWHLGRSDISRAYFGTDSRAYQLLLGAALALSPEVIRALKPIAGRAPFAAPALAVALVVGATSLLDLSPVNRGFVAAGLAVALLALLEASPGDPLKSLLSTSSLVALGRVSYGIYLFHWPVLVILDQQFSLPAPAVTAIIAGSATAITFASSSFLELPIRRSPFLDQRRRLVVAAGLGSSILLGLAIVPLLQARAPESTVIRAEGADTEEAGGEPGTPVVLDWQAARNDSGPRPACTPDDLDGCLLHDGGGMRVMVLGDSQSWSLTPALIDLATEHGWSLWGATRGGCDWQQDITRIPTHLAADGAAYARECLATVDEWYRALVPAVDPEVVILAGGTGALEPKQALKASGDQLRWGSRAHLDATAQASAATVDSLTSAGRMVVIVEPAPHLAAGARDQIDCLSEASTTTDVDACSYRAIKEPLDRIYRDLATGDEVRTVNLDDLVCPPPEGGWGRQRPECPAVIDGEIVRMDNSHVTASFVQLHRDELFGFLAGP